MNDGSCGLLDRETGHAVGDRCGFILDASHGRMASGVFAAALALPTAWSVVRTVQADRKKFGIGPVAVVEEAVQVFDSHLSPPARGFCGSRSLGQSAQTSTTVTARVQSRL
jgi:hypothetical protein